MKKIGLGLVLLLCATAAHAQVIFAGYQCADGDAGLRRLL